MNPEHKGGVIFSSALIDYPYMDCNYSPVRKPIELGILKDDVLGGDDIRPSSPERRESFHNEAAVLSHHSRPFFVP